MANSIVWMLRCNLNGLYYRRQIPSLTNEQLIFCLEQETRKGGKKLLAAEAKKRKLPNVCWECGCVDNRACPGGCYWVKPGLCSQCAQKDVILK